MRKLTNLIVLTAFLALMVTALWVAGGRQIEHAAIEGCANATAYRYAVQGYPPIEALDLARIECQEASP